MHQYINQMQEHEFVLWVIGANAEKRGKFVYELPENVVEVHEVFLDDALQVKEKGKMSHIFSEKELESLSELMQMKRPDWETLFSLYHDKHLNPMAFLKSETFLDLLIKICKEQYPYIAFADAFHTMRSTAAECGRKVAVTGRSMENVTKVAMDLGYMKPPKNTVVDINKIKSMPLEKQVIVTTGSQGEVPSRQEHGSLVRWRPMKNGSATILMRSGIIIP